MTELPDVKLRGVVNFPVRVSGGTAIDIEKNSGQFTINLDVSELVQNTNISEAEVDQSWMLIWNSTTNAYEMVPYALAATSGVASLDGKTGALDIGTGLQFTGDTLELEPFSTSLDVGDDLEFTGETLDVKPFTQTGTDAQPIRYDAIVRDKLFMPEMFTNDTISAPLQTAVASVPPARDAMQACIDAVGAVGGGVVHLGPRVYNVGDGLSLPAKVYLQGCGQQSTVLLHKPTANGSCLYFGSGGASGYFKGGVYDLGIASADTTYVKIGINVYDHSGFTLKNVGVYGYPLSAIPYYTGGGGTGSIGLLTQGRELGIVENFEPAADQPIRVSVNPNASTISLDSWTFTNVIAYTGVATNSVVTIDTGIVLTNVRFNGRQNWVGGLHGLSWIDTSSSAISQGLYLSGIKGEQATDSSGFTVNIQQHSTLYNLHIADALMGDRNGFYLRNVHNTKLDNIFYDANSNPGKVGLNANTTCGIVEMSNCTWITGTTRTTTGLTLSDDTFITGFSTDLPTRGILKV